MPDHSMADTLRTFLAATTPATKEEAILVMVEHANTFGKWPTYDNDLERAQGALNGSVHGTWETVIRAQWATLRHFMGGAE
jgi:hypothetical protein